MDSDPFMEGKKWTKGEKVVRPTLGWTKQNTQLPQKGGYKSPP